jgi:hypothetical protein
MKWREVVSGFVEGIAAEHNRFRPPVKGFGGAATGLSCHGRQAGAATPCFGPEGNGVTPLDGNET